MNHAKKTTKKQKTQDLTMWAHIIRFTEGKLTVVLEVSEDVEWQVLQFLHLRSV